MEHGSPTEAVDLARALAGGVIGCDPFSSVYWNTYTVKARTFWDIDHSGLDPRNRWSGFCLVNAPGADDARGTKSLVRLAWERTVDEWRRGSIDGALYVAYSLEQATQLQGSPAHLLQFPCVFPCERWNFWYRPAGGGPPVKGTSPTHGNLAALLPSRRDRGLAKQQMAVFCELAGKLGALVRPL